MNVDPFAALAEHTRRQILNRLVLSERSVGQLVDELQVSQPVVSKHLKILRSSGFVSCRIAAQKRIYRIERKPFQELDAWLAPYRKLWTKHLDALERHLAAKEPFKEQR